MDKHSSLNTLIDLARTDADKAQKQLQSLMSDRRNAEQQLSTLQVYRRDYAERLQKATGIGLSASNYHNFRQFIATLDHAISQQNRVIAQIDSTLQKGRKRWSDEKRRQGSYETLLARQARQQVLRDNRNEQLANDELSASRFSRARPSY